MAGFVLFLGVWSLLGYLAARQLVLCPSLTQPGCGEGWNVKNQGEKNDGAFLFVSLRVWLAT